MGTKKKPGKYDCLKNLKDNEPFFVLRAQDHLAAVLVSQWAALADLMGCPREKVDEALSVAEAMDKWPTKKFPD